MIRISFTKNTDINVPKALAAKRERIIASVTEASRRMMAELMRRVQKKLSGEVLQTRRGAGGLLGSVRMVDESTGTKVAGYVVAGGGTIKIYPEVHEYGGTRQYEIVPKNKYALAFFPGASAGAAAGGSALPRVPGGATFTGTPLKFGTLFQKGLGVKYKAGKNRGSIRPNKTAEFSRLGGIVVKRVVHPPLPERSFMRSSLEELRGRISEQIREALISGAS